MSTAIVFPEIPDYRARWAPVFIEPIMNSGERITIGIAAIGQDGEFSVAPTLSEAPLRCAFGDNGAALLNTAQACIESLNEAKNVLDEWTSPFSGVELGSWREAAGDDLRSIIKNAMNMVSSFSLMATETDDRAIRGDEGTLDRWPALVKQATVERRRDLAGNFGKVISIVPNARPSRFDYIGVHLAVNLSRLLPNQLSSSVKTSKSKLFDLQMLRNFPSTLTLDHFALIAWRPRKDDPAWSERQIANVDEAIAELSAEAEKIDIAMDFAEDQAEASSFIVEREAA
jgi:hypothetical protein